MGSDVIALSLEKVFWLSDTLFSGKVGKSVLILSLFVVPQAVNKDKSNNNRRYMRIFIMDNFPP